MDSQIRASQLSPSISAILASSSSRLPVSFISASSSFSFIEHLLVANGHARMIQESDVCYTTSMYVTQSWCIPDEIDLCYFRICIITHSSNLFNKTSMYSHSKFCPQKTPIRKFDVLKTNICPRSEASRAKHQISKGQLSDR